jgi:hypothetical protein
MALLIKERFCNKRKRRKIKSMNKKLPKYPLSKLLSRKLKRMNNQILTLSLRPLLMKRKIRKMIKKILRKQKNLKAKPNLLQMKNLLSLRNTTRKRTRETDGDFSLNHVYLFHYIYKCLTLENENHKICV